LINYKPKIDLQQYIKFRKSIYSKQHIALRKFWISKRLELGLSQVELAKKIMVVQSLIAKIETGLMP